MNMNMIMPGGKRSLQSTVVSYIAKFICLSMQKQQQQLQKTSDVSYEDILQKMIATFSGFALSKSGSGSGGGGGGGDGGSTISGHLSSRQIEHMIVGRCQSNFS